MCSICGQSTVYTKSVKTDFKSTSTCSYTKEQAQNWRYKILCIKTNNLYTQAEISTPDINKYLGVLNSIVIYNNHPCQFRKELDVIYDAILRIIDLELCQ